MLLKYLVHHNKCQHEFLSLDGSVTDVKVGQSIPGTSYKVASITGNGVWIQNGTEKRQLIL
ncbi:type IV pilus biogenesis protein PilP [Escherichia coli]|nr:type IV pilus biogenesis protein PilP [Escherichia coli]